MNSSLRNVQPNAREKKLNLPVLYAWRRSARLQEVPFPRQNGQVYCTVSCFPTCGVYVHFADDVGDGTTAVGRLVKSVFEKMPRSVMDELQEQLGHTSQTGLQSPDQGVFPRLARSPPRMRPK